MRFASAGLVAFAGVGYLARHRDRYDGIDCGDRAGTALAALREGWKVVAFSGPAKVRRKLAEIATRRGARIESGRGLG